MLEKYNQYAVYGNKSEDKGIKSNESTPNEKGKNKINYTETTEFKKLKELLQIRNNKSMNFKNEDKQVSEKKFFKSYENITEIAKNEQNVKIKHIKTEESHEVGKNFEIGKIKTVSSTFYNKIKEEVSNASETSKEKIGKILKEKFSGMNEYKKLITGKNSKIFRNSDKRNLENKRERVGEFYYISKLSKSLKLGEKVLKETIEKGSAFDYEYQLVTPETSQIDISLEEDPKKNPYFNHFHHCLQSIAFVSTLDQLPDDEFLEKKVYLPPKKNKFKKTLILDLDETLVHCSEDLTKPSDFKTPIKFTGGEVINFGVTIRPYAIEFLELMSEFFEIVIFTASHACYANIILNILDPENQFITYRMFRDSCIETEERIFIKDLRIFGNRNFENMVIVDNACYSYCFQLENGIPIVPYFNGKKDTELIELAAFLTYYSKNLQNFGELKQRKEQGVYADNIKFGDRLIENDFKGFIEKVDERIWKYDEAFDGKLEGTFKKNISGYFKCMEYKKSLERFGDQCSVKLANVIQKFVEEIEK